MYRARQGQAYLFPDYMFLTFFLILILENKIFCHIFIKILQNDFKNKIFDLIKTFSKMKFLEKRKKEKISKNCKNDQNYLNKIKIHFKKNKYNKNYL